MHERAKSPGVGDAGRWLRHAALLLAAAWAFQSAPARAQERCLAVPSAPPGEQAVEELAVLDLESLLDVEIYSSTKTSQRGASAPAVVTVVTADEIRDRGYTSLADVLRTVPGFYDVYDLVSHNVGVRGINGGRNAGGSVIKLMIDNHPVDYRPTTENFFGEELIPMEVVERIEIIRGPASALYGANAYLGVVNIVTRCGRGAPGVELVGHGMLVRGKPGAGAGVTLSGGEEHISGVVSAKLMQWDRSGLDLPASSPVLLRPASPVPARGASQDDLARPKTFFSKVSVGGAAGTVTAVAIVQNLDAVGEFQTAGLLTHGTRISLLNQNLRLIYEKQLTQNLGFTASVFYLSARPTPDDQLDVGQRGSVLKRSVGVDGWGAQGEGKVTLGADHTVTFGADYQDEDHLLPAYEQLYTEDVLAPNGTVVTRAGTRLPGEGLGQRKRLQNLGVYGQGLATLKQDFSAVVGVRLDYHNIYGANLSTRAGLVYAPLHRPISLKLLYGSSYKAPSASQLYAHPIGAGDVRGNPDLKPQTAHTVEAAAGTSLPDERGEISVNLFATNISGRVEFRQSGLFQRATNVVTELVVGGELASRVVLARPLHLRFMTGLARTVWQKSEENGPVGGPLATTVTNQLFPPLQCHLILDYHVFILSLRSSLEVSYISDRDASQSNALEKGAPYRLPGYAYTGASLSWARKLFGDRETRVAARFSNVLNRRWSEPGFAGADVPAVGAQAVFTLSQAL
ncbi:MAG: TonB-dependent receptor [Myxococcota bacterium]